MTVNILGTDYTIKNDTTVVNSGLDGDCNDFSKVIRIRDVAEMLDATAVYAEKEERVKQVKRHELLHAFFHESGLEEYSTDEVLVDWIAIQAPKLMKAFQEAGAI